MAPTDESQAANAATAQRGRHGDRGGGAARVDLGRRQLGRLVGRAGTATRHDTRHDTHDTQHALADDTRIARQTQKWLFEQKGRHCGTINHIVDVGHGGVWTSSIDDRNLSVWAYVKVVKLFRLFAADCSLHSSAFLWRSAGAAHRLTLNATRKFKTGSRW